ncbi:prenyl protein protease [Phyllosticta citribraziliensis]
MAPINFLQRLKLRINKAPVPTAPAISPRSAALLSVLFTVIYVVPFYLSKTTRPSQTLHRDAPSVIRARIRAVTSSCIVSTLITLYVLFHHGHATLPEALHYLGWWPISVPDIFKTILLLCVLFAGPLFEYGVVDGEWRNWIKGRHVNETLSSWIGWRNFVAGPTTEELVWRSLLVPLHLYAHVSPSAVVFTTPLYFGIAHVHHYYEFRLTHPHTGPLAALFRSLFQFTYTSLFGFFAAFVFLRTASLPAAIAAHSFCNWMGLPRLWGRVAPPTDPFDEPVAASVEAVSIGPAGVDGEGKRFDGPVNGRCTKCDGDRCNKCGGKNSGGASGEAHVAWTVAYYILLVAGALGFYKLLWTLTESESALVVFGASGEKAT